MTAVPTPAAAQPVRRSTVLPLIAAVAVGALSALQAHVNGALGVELRNGVLAAVISFGTGFALLLVWVAVLPSGRAAVGRLGQGIRERRIPWWLLVGGASGALAVATQGLVVGVIGTALFTVGLLAGQSLSALILDRVGYSPGGVILVTAARITGVALAIAAVAVPLVTGGVREAPLWMLILPVLAGAAMAWQQGTNGRLQVSVGSALAATLVNFAGGTLVLALIALVQVPQIGSAGLPGTPWLYTGGVLGVAFIFVSAALVPRVGVLMLSLASTLGMLIGSYLLDLVWPPAVPLSPLWAAVTVVVACAGVSIAGAGRRGVRSSTAAGTSSSSSRLRRAR